jgi:hypothetical protein
MLIATALIIVVRVRSSEPFAAFAPSAVASPYVIGSMPIDLSTKYPAAYYSEMSNEEFERAVRATFATPATCVATAAAATSGNWRLLAPAPQGLYHIMDTHLIGALQRGLAASKQLGTGVPTGVPTGVRMVFRRYMELLTHVTKPETYLVRIEAILHRKNAFHGKHMELGVVFQKEEVWGGSRWSTEVVTARVVGVVFEDAFGTHPAVPRDPQERPELGFDPNPLVPAPPVLLSNDEVVAAVRAQAEGQRKWAEAESVVASA